MKDAGTCLKTLRVEVAPDAVAAVREAVEQDVTRAAQVPGFRTGRAPLALVRQRYGTKVREETIRRAIGEYLPKALEQSKLDLLGDPEVTEVSLDDGRPLTFTAQCEIVPEIPLKPIRGLKLTRQAVAVTDTQVESVLAALQERYATLEPVAGQAEKVKKVPALDDAFSALVGVETLEQLRARVREDLTRELTAQQRHAVEDQAVQKLLDQTSFEVPPSIVQSQAERLLRESQWRLLSQGTTPDEVESRKALLAESSKQGALRQVKTFFLLRQVAKAQGLAATESEIEQRIGALAAQSQRTPEQVRAELQRERLLSELVWDVTRGKVLDWLLAQAQIEEKTA
ncbi:MAG: hypothetical protein A3C53_00085 [Omnitrophica WOR_2 bacterium RIFCSPHIGHO2_02_FULL_68_15]|nr:MAG: hypothetical protein A3C53_00085 [Omnitrophica WOR_2 bacterium RIFCSPHIGHO2_02_FULL_68_15]